MALGTNDGGDEGGDGTGDDCGSAVSLSHLMLHIQANTMKITQFHLMLLSLSLLGSSALSRQEMKPGYVELSSTCILRHAQKIYYFAPSISTHNCSNPARSTSLSLSPLGSASISSTSPALYRAYVLDEWARSVIVVLSGRK